MENSILLKSLGTRIRELRKLKNISQMDLAYSIEMSMNTVSYIELGKVSPKVDTLNKIAQRLEVDIFELFDFGSSSSVQANNAVRKKVEVLSRKLLECDSQTISTITQLSNIIIKKSED